MADTIRLNSFKSRERQYFYIYILRCNDQSIYVGCTSNLANRLDKHRHGKVSYTETRLPIQLVCATAFPEKYKAYQFEHYLKSGSGRVLCCGTFCNIFRRRTPPEGFISITSSTTFSLQTLYSRHPGIHIIPKSISFIIFLSFLLHDQLFKHHPFTE